MQKSQIIEVRVIDGLIRFNGGCRIGAGGQGLKHAHFAIFDDEARNVALLEACVEI